jgi:diacylglycerol kinase family enzyme
MPLAALLVANPTAQSGKNAARIAQAQTLLDRAGVVHTLLPTLPAGATVGAVSEALRGGDWRCVIAMGGDGTFSEVARGLHASGRAEDIPLAMLPTGTANDQGRSFGLSADPMELARNVAVLARGHETRLDAGRLRALDADGGLVQEALFFDSAGWGFSPRTLAARNEDRKVIEGIPVVRELWRDQLVYGGAMLRTFLEGYVENDRFDVALTLDGKAHGWTRLTDLIVKGTRVYGGLWVLDPTSAHDDGAFEVVPMTGRRDWLSKAMVRLDASGKLEEALRTVGVSHSAELRGAHMDVPLHPAPGALPLYAQMDGEEFPATARAHIDVLPRALRLIVPRET